MPLSGRLDGSSVPRPSRQASLGRRRSSRRPAATGTPRGLVRSSRSVPSPSQHLPTAHHCPRSPRHAPRCPSRRQAVRPPDADREPVRMHVNRKPARRSAAAPDGVLVSCPFGRSLQPARSSNVTRTEGIVSGPRSTAWWGHCATRTSLIVTSGVLDRYERMRGGDSVARSARAPAALGGADQRVQGPTASVSAVRRTMGSHSCPCRPGGNERRRSVRDQRGR
jgi:hypothetical protein